MLVLKTFLATAFVPGTACLLVPYYILKTSGLLHAPEFGFPQMISLGGFVLGLMMIIWVSINFVKKGEGTPVPIDPPKKLVTSGIYRFVRNPMYFGALLIIVSESFYFNSLLLILYAAFLWFAFQVFLVIFEEPQLKKRFGKKYEEYIGKVPRWIPKIPR